MIEREELRRLAEAILWDYDPRDLSHDLELVDRPDLLLWTRPSQVKWASRVAYARWPEADAEHGIDEVLAFFRQRERPFVWFVGPSSTPPDLAERVLRCGLAKEPAGHLLIATLPLRDLRTNEAVRVEDVVDEAGIERHLRFSWPEWDEAQIRNEIPARMARKRVYGERAGWLLAYLGDEIVANASWRDSTDGRVVYLTGAGTKPESRGRGIYQTLVAYRAERARARGRRHAVINAQADTSMPILLRRGFVDLGELPAYSLPE